MKINYAALQPLDRIDCSGRGPFALITRRVTAGRKNAFNKSIPVHTGIVVEWRGQLLCAEMSARGIEINPLSKYEKPGRRSIVNVSRHHILSDAKINDRIHSLIVNDYRHSLEYDFKGLLEFVFTNVKDDKNKYYCSEYFYHLTKNYIQYPGKFRKSVAPYDLFENDLVTGFKPVKNWHL